MDINELMAQLLKLGHAEVGKGPKNPMEPATDLEDSLKELLTKCPFLKRDDGYISFLENYAGASLEWPNKNLIIDIFGLTNVASHLMDGEYDLVDERGFYCFAYIIIKADSVHMTTEDSVHIYFSFDASGQRPWGIYRHFGEGNPTDCYCETFLEWFEDVINKRGKLY